MGQAAVDLPDPLHQPSLDNTPSADDLLSQMAGDEIDRLLSEAEVDRPPASPDTPPAEVSQPQSVETTPPPAIVQPKSAAAVDESDPDIARQIDDLFKELNGPPPPPVDLPPIAAEVPAAPTPKPDEADPNISQQLDDLFQQLATDPVTTPTESQPAPATSAAQPEPLAAASATEQPPTPEINPADQVSEPERQTLTAAIPDAAEPETPSHVTVVQSPPPDLDDAVPLFLRPLVWLNRPVASCGDGVRRIIGNIAIMTLVNALMLIAYVLVFRR